MKINNFLLYIILIFIPIFFVECTTKKIEFETKIIPLYSDNSQLIGYDTILKSNPYFYKINKTGVYYLYYYSGELKEKAEFKNDTLINENVLYSKSGKELSYRFYNPDGELKFLLENNKYDISSYCPFMYFVYKYHASIKDTISIQVYVATPFGIMHDLYGISDQGTPFVLNYTRSRPYLYIFNFIPDKVGNVKLKLKLEYTNFNSRIIDEYFEELDFVITK